MYSLMLGITGLILFVLLPLFTIMLIVKALKRKPIKRILLAIGISAICLFAAITIGLFNVPEEMVAELSTTTEAETTTELVTEIETTIQYGSVMVEQFKALGFTQEEAEEMESIFNTVGITKIRNIRYALGTGIDDLQSFVCDIFDYSKDAGGVSVHFTIDKRQLCFISLDGIPATKTDYYYIDIFGNVKAKTSSGKKSVTLYDVWDDNGEIIPNAVGYKAVFDYENKKITAY